MECVRRTCFYDVIITSGMLMLATALVFPGYARAECLEFKIVEYEDRVEAVCVGEPLTEAQKKANLEEEKRQEQLNQRQKAEQLRVEKESAAANKARTEAEAAALRKSQAAKPVPPRQPLNRNTSSNPQIIRQ